MSKKNIKTKLIKNQYHHLTKDDRIKIQTLVNIKDVNGKRLFNNSYIAKELNVNRSTISRELNKRKSYRFMVRSGKSYPKPYNAIDAHNNYLFKRGLSKGEYKLRKYKNMKAFIEEKIIKNKWSPDVIVGFMKRHEMFDLDGFEYITVPTIYNAIRNGIINVKLSDTRRMKENVKYNNHLEKTSLSASKIPYSIDTRPLEINDRLTFGHFEIDTVIGKRNGKHECLLTITERKSRYEIIFKIESKTSEAVTNKINQLKLYFNSNYEDIFKSFTTDNGSEFSDYLGIISNSKTKIYFCHPYCSGEKGTNEKHNSMIRYFIPKNTLIEDFSYKQINEIAMWMNNYPRKVLNYKTPLEVLQQELKSKTILNKINKLQEQVNCYL